MNDVYTEARFDRWVVQPMVNMRFSNIPFNKDGNLCRYVLQAAYHVAQPMPLG